MNAFKVGDRVRGKVTSREGTVKSIAPGGMMSVVKDNGDTFEVQDFNAELLQAAEDVTKEHVIRWYGDMEDYNNINTVYHCTCDLASVIMVIGCQCGGS